MTLSNAAREQSAALASLLGQNGNEGGTPTRAPTVKGRLMLMALNASHKGAATPAELAGTYGDWFAGWTRQSFHLCANTLVNEGWVRRRRRMVRSAVSGKMQGGPRMYQLTDEGRAVL
jgi:hypothetical protein